MNFFIQLLEVFALVVPDFLVLDLVAAAFFNFYCIAKAYGITGTTEVDSGFVIALTLAYFVTIAVNVVSHFLAPARPRTTTMSRLESLSAGVGCESRPEERRARSVEQGGMSAAL